MMFVRLIKYENSEGHEDIFVALNGKVISERKVWKHNIYIIRHNDEKCL